MIQKVNDKIKLQAYIKISNVFNVEDLTQWKGDAPFVVVFEEENHSNLMSGSYQSRETDDD